ncbi:biotin--[acetyl-CoA-carboxylase] ligase [Marinomonas ostreistagni]|uniref:biotin--[acetyl-CoA-carboxylase] ligase n=1 Tax=Marinomonas ostreistagni TaxID=359209 RepID=UPI00195218CB|nr:biotin--[acetyl-CoA-carboxylase] ligase [Marinomonas ostreistagni]MBM6552285.1 biotin--[acetyl-CoA-carboxylase] ligase [Marinomonas ostreistagni]
MRDVLALLSDSKFHSGEELGEALGITRAAVWKRLKKLDAAGITVHSVKGRGYRIPAPITLLSEARLRAAGVASNIGIDVPFDTPSTNDILKQKIALGSSLPALVVTEHQTQGKGRRGRVWESGVAKNITMSFGWKFDQGPSVIEGLSLAVGVVIAQVLRQLGIPNPGLKWPNDIHIDGQKICGILLEMVADQDVCRVVIGIGLNVESTQEQEEKVDQPWTDLARRLSSVPDRNQVIAAIVQGLQEVCEVFERGQGLSHYLPQWQAFDVLYNQPVRVFSGTRQQEGIARGVDESGALRLETESGIELLHGGEISVRKQ